MTRGFDVVETSIADLRIRHSFRFADYSGVHIIILADTLA